jgi:hypothetical protein
LKYNKGGQPVADNVVALHFGRLSLSRITYHCDLQRADGPVIPLGVMAEFSVGHARVLGLIARTTLDQKELAIVGRMVREKLAVPFDFLKSDFDWACKEIEAEKLEAGRALKLLAARYTDSLFFAPPTEERVRATADFALAEMRRRRDEDFYSMIADLLGQRRIPPSKDISELAA